VAPAKIAGCTLIGCQCVNPTADRIPATWPWANDLDHCLTTALSLPQPT
jgi:hypothetical protein